MILMLQIVFTLMMVTFMSVTLLSFTTGAYKRSVVRNIPSSVLSVLIVCQWVTAICLLIWAWTMN